MKRFVLAGLALLLAIPAAHAGIVITKNGKVFIGRIEAEDVTDKTVTIRSPRLRPGERPAAGNKMVFERSELRWFDERADEPTDPYFDRFLDEPLDTAWSKYAADYIERQKTKLPPAGVAPRLVPIALARLFHRCEVALRRPIGWTTTEANGIVIFESDDHRARIHLFASDLTGERALVLAQKTLERCGNRIDSRTETSKGREWLTTFEGKKRTVKALRRIVQTDKSTAFAVAYADERDFERLASLLRESLETLHATEQP